MIFTTESGSRYEISDTCRKIRRLEGQRPTTARQGQDGEWRVYADISCRIGEPAVIFWPGSTPLLEGSPDGAIPATVTSRVVSVEAT